MTAKDFRIGNWIDSSEDGYFQIEQLCKLSPDSKNQNVGARYRGGTFWTDCEAIIGIPLTEDWLNRLGFENFKTDYGIMLNTPDRHLVIMPVRNEFYPCIEVEAEFASGERQVCHLERIEYLHELQNLYYVLTKKELVLAVTPKRKN